MCTYRRTLSDDVIYSAVSCGGCGGNVRPTGIPRAKSRAEPRIVIAGLAQLLSSQAFVPLSNSMENPREFREVFDVKFHGMHHEMSGAAQYERERERGREREGERERERERRGGERGGERMGCSENPGGGEIQKPSR